LLSNADCSTDFMPCARCFQSTHDNYCEKHLLNHMTLSKRGAEGNLHVMNVNCKLPGDRPLNMNLRVAAKDGRNKMTSLPYLKAGTKLARKV